MQTLVLRSVRDRILAALYRHPQATILDEFLRLGAEIHVLGGAVRDALSCDFEQNGDWKPRDFDIGISGIHPRIFEEMLSAVAIKNRHGGFVLKERGFPTWDIWRLEQSIGLRATGSSYSIENVLRSFNLDCNSLSLNIGTGVLIDSGAIDAIRGGTIGYVPNVIRHSFATFAAKALLTHLRFGYVPSVELQHLIATYLNHRTLAYESSKIFPGFPLIASGARELDRLLPAAD